MARKRMISLDVINTDKFLNLPLATRGLYFHLNCEADDDGFISSALRTIRAVDGTEEMLNELVDAEYLIRFDSGIYLVKHWLLHNCIQKDRYTPSICTAEREQVRIVDRVYCLSVYTDCIQIVYISSLPIQNLTTYKILYGVISFGLVIIALMYINMNTLHLKIMMSIQNLY